MKTFKQFKEETDISSISSKNNPKIYEKLGEKQKKFAISVSEIVEENGKYDKGTGKNGSHFIVESDNPFIENNIICKNCLFFKKNFCSIVEGDIPNNSICKLWTITEDIIIP